MTLLQEDLTIATDLHQEMIQGIIDDDHHLQKDIIHLKTDLGKDLHKDMILHIEETGKDHNQVKDLILKNKFQSLFPEFTEISGCFFKERRWFSCFLCLLFVYICLKFNCSKYKEFKVFIT